jgi:hypothetical protein
MTMSDHDIPASVTIVTLGYRACCTEPGCRNLGRLILRYADAGGRPCSNSEFCHAHGRARIAQASGLKVFDNRDVAEVARPKSFS